MNRLLPERRGSHVSGPLPALLDVPASSPPPRNRLALRAYVTVVMLGGAIMLAAGLASSSDGPVDPARVALFAVLALLTELLPIRLLRGFELNVSLSFVFALLLAGGPGPALAVAAGAGVVADLLQRKPLWRGLFNGLQAALALGAGASALSLLDPDGHTRMFASPRDLPIIALAALVIFAVNHFAVAGALALHQGLPLTSLVGPDLVLHGTSTLMMVILAPVLLVASDHSLFLVPLLLVPVGAVYFAARALSERDRQAFTDRLTGLNNRAWFHEAASILIGDDGPAPAVGGRGLAVMLIDLDRFKEVNDTLGHQVGDQLLEQIGPRLSSTLAEGDLLARFGGDEFGILLNGVPDAAAALERGGQILEGLEQPFPLSGLSLDIEASMGIALYPEHGTDVDTLVRRADVAMYLAKESRRGAEIYNAGRDPYSPEKLTMLGELRRALEGEECVLHYQPKARISDGVIVGAEVLLRWAHPLRGLLAPDAFIPLAERTGLSRSLTLYVLERALKQCRRWHDLGLSLTVAVNLSVRNLHDGTFPRDVRRLLDETGVPASSLQLEITEGTVMADPTRVSRVLQILRNMGVEIALDDFGTGYSSLSYLKNLPVDELKIDKSFVTTMCVDANDAAIVRSTIDLARHLGKRTVAEGVEDQAVWDQLAKLGCEVAQGFWLGRPTPADDLTRVLLQREASGPALLA
ncbi:MAG TPA: EAL domain-containing protein [Acidimicrobiales bacterium]|nr:EAL domain-containing protein [Acidimicrobiales bacterium]